MKKLLFVYNPRAGKEMLKPRLSDVLDIFVKAGYEVTVHPTQAYRDAYYQIKEYEVGKLSLIHIYKKSWRKQSFLSSISDGRTISTQ